MSGSAAVTSSSDLPGIRLGVVRGISYGLFGKPGEFVPQARALGATLIRAYLYWGQIEPEPGRYEWDVIDALMDQLSGDEELWITLCSSSPWATRVPTDFLPPSPAHDPRAYGSFVRRVVRRCAGRVRYWQCDNEPSNTGLLWAGTAEEYVAQLTTMYAAVKEADPAAAVVLGGCGYDVIHDEDDGPARRFFAHVLEAGRDAFDLFDVHLYGDARGVEAGLATAGRLLREHGCAQPVVVGEHGAPVPFQFPEAGAALYETFGAAFADAPATQSTAELAERAGRDTAERRAVSALYDRMPSLPPTLGMFLDGCPADLEAKRHRINARQLVMTTLLALAAGVRRTAYWNLAPEVPGPVDPRQIMALMFGKLPLLDYSGGALGVRRPAADAFALLAGQLDGVRRVTRVEVPGHPRVYAFEVDRAGRERLLVLWEDRDVFDGEDEPPVTVAVPWPVPWDGPGATAVDALGGSPAVEVADGRLLVEVSLTPVFVTVFATA
ncbi:hypothetical protein JOL79_04355 [Microbispora sp. RL4-1S]|uniref:Glycoside hydrolase family 42 N-terminal domain-containing protein n=1 Tax=Microbispora oryzae TaxID=2806554 RepID=A0A941AHS0_9ACTN|nr:hypothetical protein [Microbispora oryzae]MBP2703032.1 hypothetical protein [Microbispora oryzae]